MSKLTLGVIGTSKKPDERRVPIHPKHLSRVPEAIRRQLIFEEGYGAPFTIPVGLMPEIISSQHTFGARQRQASGL